jgi:YVTN family beta-propeller protein
MSGAYAARQLLIPLCLSFGLMVQGQQPQPSVAAHLRRMSTLVPTATFHVGGDPDWMAVADDSVWVTSSALNRVTQLNADGNTIGLAISVKQPCSGLRVGFGSLWIPSCGSHAIVRADLKTGQIQAVIPISPANSEGCIAAGAGSVWLTTSTAGILSRIDPASNSVVASITIPSGSFCPVFAGGFIWVTSTEHSLLSKVDPSTNRVLAKIPVGENPRFATAGAGSVWTLNQGDGTVSRVDTKTGKTRCEYPCTALGPRRRDRLWIRRRLGNIGPDADNAHRSAKQLGAAPMERRWRRQHSRRYRFHLADESEGRTGLAPIAGQPLTHSNAAAKRKARTNTGCGPLPVICWS